MFCCFCVFLYFTEKQQNGIVETQLIASVRIRSECCVIVQTLHCNVFAIAMENMITETLQCNVCTNNRN